MVIDDLIKQLGPLPPALSKMPRPTPPHRAFELSVQISGDTWKDILRELRETVRHIEDHGRMCTSVLGGWSSSHIVNVRVDETVTHESWEAALERHLHELDEWKKAQEVNR